ncbi:MAG: metallophosphoesterase [Bacteroidota bacterium]|nr:metallophosphoesterase [Bacteroidota bacterium]
MPAMHAQTATENSAILAFASDTQEPMRVEELVLRSHENRKATRALFKEIISQRPAELFLLGDVVNLGHRDERWSYIDTALHDARKAGITVNAILGNHELMGRSAQGAIRFQTRFPQHVKTGYTVIKDSIAVVLLNSNFKKMPNSQIREQNEWYKTILAALDTAPEIKAVIVCCHHSPYSYSKLVGSNGKVQRLFVAPFLKHKKTKLFLSGHAHLFQHFHKDGKNFFVIGGGGGLNHPLRRRTGPEVALGGEYAPLFHYLTVQLCGDRLRLVSRRLLDDMSAFEDGAVFEFPINDDPATEKN